MTVHFAMTTQPRSTTIWVLALVGATAAAVGAVTLSAPRGTHDSAAQGASTAAPSPTFGQAEEARRYHDAITEGNLRTIQVLEEALRVAKAQPSRDLARIDLLELELAKRRRE